MPIFVTVLYNPSSKIYCYDKCLLDFDAAVSRINYFHDTCSIIIYEYDTNIELFNTLFGKHILKKVVTGKDVIYATCPTPMDTLLINQYIEHNHILLFTN